jgi:hypothetical protein
MTPQTEKFILDLLLREWEEVLNEMQKQTDHTTEEWSKMTVHAAHLYSALMEFKKAIKTEEPAQ